MREEYKVSGSGALGGELAVDVADIGDDGETVE